VKFLCVCNQFLQFFFTYNQFLCIDKNIINLSDTKTSISLYRQKYRFPRYHTQIHDFNLLWNYNNRHFWFPSPFQISLEKNPLGNSVREFADIVRVFPDVVSSLVRTSCCGSSQDWNSDAETALLQSYSICSLRASAFSASGEASRVGTLIATIFGGRDNLLS
jgi:hypothetical protein